MGLGSITDKLEGKPHKLHHTIVSVCIYYIEKKKIITYTFSI